MSSSTAPLSPRVSAHAISGRALPGSVRTARRVAVRPAPHRRGQAVGQARGRQAPPGPRLLNGLAREELLQLHRGAHVAFELELARHVGARRVLLARDDLLKDLLRGTDRAIHPVYETVVHADAAFLDLDRPLAGTFDVKGVRVVHARRLRRVGAGRKRLEELLHVAWHPSLLLGVPASLCSGTR